MRILVLPGDGIGPEITAATLTVLGELDASLDLGIEIESCDIGLLALERNGSTLSEATMARIPEVDGVVLGPVSHYDYPDRAHGGINPSAELRTVCELFANIRPCVSRADLSILRRPMDLVIVRENTEGFYSDRNMFAGSGEFMTDENTALSIRKITAKASSRVARTAFELARKRRRKVTAVHKANVVKLSDALFLREVRKVAQEFPDVELEEMIVDAAAALLIRRPDDFDVIVTTNMFGDILSDEASELSGSLGLGGSINAGYDICVAQAQHGSAPDIARRDMANPTSLIRSAAMLLDWYGERAGNQRFVDAACLLHQAVERVLDVPDRRTADLGGTTGTAEFAAFVVAELRTGVHLATPGTRPDHEAIDMSAALAPPNLLIDPTAIQPLDRGNGVTTVPYVGAWNSETSTITTGQTTFAPGTALPRHSHDVEESVLIIEGEAMAEIGDTRIDLVTGQATWVPAGTPHRFANRGQTPMRIYWVYGGRAVTRTITATDETFEHLSPRDRGGIEPPSRS